MSKLEDAIVQLIPHNLALHVIAGALVFAGSHRLGALYAMGLVLLAGIAKELYDYFTPGHDCDWQGIAATVCGGLICLSATL